MGFIAKLSRRIGDDLVRSSVVKAEDAEIYIYGINQILFVIGAAMKSVMVKLLAMKVLSIQNYTVYQLMLV